MLDDYIHLHEKINATIQIKRKLVSLLHSKNIFSVKMCVRWTKVCNKLIVYGTPVPYISYGDRLNNILKQIFFVMTEVMHFHSHHLFLACNFLSLLRSDINDKTLDTLCNAVLFGVDSFVLSCSE